MLGEGLLKCVALALTRSRRMRHETGLHFYTVALHLNMHETQLVIEIKIFVS